MEEHPLKVARERHNWSQSRLAKELGVSTRTVIRWEQGHAVPYPIYREQLCQIFETTAVELGLVSDRDDSEVVQDQRASTSYNQSIYDPYLPETLGLPQRLLGRDELLKQIKQQLMGKERQLAITALQGLPGIGKTALAAAIATDPEIQRYFSDGVLWAGLGPQGNVMSVLTRWGVLLGVKASDVANPSQVSDWISAVRAAIGHRRLLLVIDDVWSAQVALSLQIGGSQCAHLLTTRIPTIGYAFAQEATVVVPELSEEDGLALLTRLVPQVVEQEPEAARELVQEVGGLPLALNLLGRYLAAQVYTGQLRRVQTALERLRDGEQRLRVSQAVPLGERSPAFSNSASLSLQAAISLSVQLLTPEEQGSLAALALFPAKPNSFSEEAAVAVADAPVEQLDRLWDAGLLESSGVGRYALHQTIVDYAQLQPLDTAAQQRLISYMVEYVQVHERDFAALELETNNVLTALDTANQLGEYQSIKAGVLKFSHFMDAYGLYTVADRYLQMVLSLARTRGDREGEAQLLMRLVAFTESRGEYERAETDGQRGLELARELGLRTVECDLLSTLGNVSARCGDYPQSSAYYNQGLELARQLADSDYISRLLSQYSRIIALRGDYGRAEQLCQEGIGLAELRGDQELMSRLYSTWGVIFGRQGQWAQAEEKFQQGLQCARRSGHRESMITALINLGGIFNNEGKNAEAEAVLKEGLEIARQIGHRAQISTLLSNLGATLGLRAEYGQAERYFQEAVDLAEELGVQETLPLLLSNLGAAIGYQEDYERADKYFARAAELARQQNALWELTGILLNWGEQYLRQNELEKAKEAFQQIEDLNEHTARSPQILFSARYGMAQISALHGDIAEARRLGQEVLQTFMAMGHYQAKEVEQWLASLLPDEEKKPSISDKEA